MSRFVFPIIAGLGLILMKVLPELAPQVLRIVDDVPIRPRVIDDVPTVRPSPSPAEVALDKLVRVASEVPIRELDQATLARLETSPAFRAEPVRRRVVEGPRYTLNRIAAEVTQTGVRNIREYTEYVEATHAAITTIPRNLDEFNGVFGRLPSANETNALLSEADLVVREFHHVSDEASLLKGIKEQEVNFVSIVGHNEDGLLRLPSGELIEITKIAQHCSSVGKKCIFLSCNSEEFLSAAADSAFGVDRRITFKGAHRIANYLGKRMRESESMSYMRVSDDLRAELNVLAQAANISDAISTTTPPVLVAGGIGGVYFAVNNDKQ